MIGSRETLSSMRTAVLALPILLAACQTGSPDYTEFRSRQDTVTTMARIAENIGQCWFGDDRAAFAGYSYAPELTSYSNRPRVLIVPADDPGGLPVLVVEASRDGRQTHVRLFGPLMGSGEARRIASDVEEWTEGSTSC